nr:MAG TPA: hypothetical protein [Caudoviricetes sp.]
MKYGFHILREIMLVELSIYLYLYPNIACAIATIGLYDITKRYMVSCQLLLLPL